MTYARSIQKDLADTSVTVEVHENIGQYMCFMRMLASASICVDIPHFISTQLDEPDYVITYFSNREYAGLTGCDAYQVSSLADIRHALDEHRHGTPPKLIIAELTHLGHDLPIALRMIAEHFEDGDMWEEQVLISVEAGDHDVAASTEQATGRAESRMSGRGYSAEVHHTDTAAFY